MTSNESVLLFKQNVWITQQMVSELFRLKLIDQTVYRKVSHGLLAHTKEILDGQEVGNA